MADSQRISNLKICAILLIRRPRRRSSHGRYTVSSEAREVAHDRIAQRMLLCLIGWTRPKLRPALGGTDAPEFIRQLASVKRLQAPSRLCRIGMRKEIHVSRRSSPTLHPRQTFRAPPIKGVASRRQCALFDIGGGV